MERGNLVLCLPSPKHTGKNSQGPIKIKIYNLYNVLHQRHLLVIFYFVLTVGRGCV